MSGERPWWLPTAVFFGPVCVLLTTATVFVGLWQRDIDRQSIAVVGLYLLLGPVLTAVHLGRAEDGWRDRTRPPHLNRWGGPAAQRSRPFWRATRAGVWLLAALAALALWARLMLSVPQSFSAPLAVVSVIAVILGGLALLTWSLRNGLIESEDPLWLRQVVWRWPVTTALASLALGVTMFVSALAAVVRGDIFYLLWLGPVYFWSIRGPLRRLRDGRHPDRHYGIRA